MQLKLDYLGKLRPVPKVDLRIREAEKLGFEYFVTANFKKDFVAQTDIKIIMLNKIEEVVTQLFG